MQNENNGQPTINQIALFGLFGVGNLGNEATLTATLLHLRTHLPDAELCCICANPTDVATRHQIKTIPMNRLTNYRWGQVQNRLIRAFLRVPLEISDWIRTYQLLRGIDLLLIPGTGILDDFGVGPSQMPLDLFRWSLLARVRGVKVRFMSIGAGPIRHPLSRWLMKMAARCADYRSYRDQLSKTFMSGIGLNTQADAVYPDLVFSLPRPVNNAEQKSEQVRRTVGLGVMTYYGWRNQAGSGEQIYQTYLAQLTRFALWLLKKGYRIRLLIGEVTDQQAVAALLTAIAVAADQGWTDQLVYERINSLTDLLQQIAASDIVVATRFHNVVGALMMSKPTISLGYAKKNAALMTEMGLGAYCQHVETFDVDQLIQHFTELEAKAPQFQAMMQEKNHQYAQALQEQYSQVTSTIISTALDNNGVVQECVTSGLAVESR